jgi:PPK2 family polyphosphate:nucleotide phosphotransferase
MNMKEIAKKAHKLTAPFRITQGKAFRLKSIDPTETLGLKTDAKPKAKEELLTDVQTLAALQERLYAEDQRPLLLIFQAMDAAGKDGVIKHVMSGVNPQGCQVHSFKAPSSEELDHDYLWRSMKALPNRGNIGIFNRSYYEEVLVVRVHPEFLDNQRLPRELITDRIWKERYKDIRNFEQYLVNNGVVILKFFLHVSKKEQKNRFLERLENPDKQWKFSATDLQERRFWDQYMEAYEEMIRHTATEAVPWYVVPADNKWFTRVVVAAAVIETLAELNPKFPEVSPARLKELATARAGLRKK